jgi:hypothetical protein
MNPRYFAIKYPCPYPYKHQPTKCALDIKASETKQIKRYDEEEIEICKKILKIPAYFLFFSPICKFSFLNTRDKYILVYREELTPFHDFFNKCTEKERVLHILTSYSHLIRGCRFLTQHGIIYENYDQIGFNRQKQPILFDFERNKTKTHYLPIEAQLLTFLENKDVLSLSKSNIEEICGNFLKTYPFNHQRPSQRECANMFVHFINKPKQVIIDEIGKYKNTWNNYGISYVFLEMLSYMNDIEMPTFFIEVLFECVGVDFTKRVDHVLHKLDLRDEAA